MEKKLYKLRRIWGNEIYLVIQASAGPGDPLLALKLCLSCARYVILNGAAEMERKVHQTLLLLLIFL